MALEDVSLARTPSTRKDRQRDLEGSQSLLREQPSYVCQVARCDKARPAILIVESSREYINGNKLQTVIGPERKRNVQVSKQSPCYYTTDRRAPAKRRHTARQPVLCSFIPVHQPSFPLHRSSS
jgi:hypothetical protein